MRMKLESILPKLKLRFDWRAYFERFAELHGGNPVPFKGRLVFQDGWTYSGTDHRGPEWPPPDDERARLLLQKVYWLVRRKVSGRERNALRDAVAGIKELQATKSAPLQQLVEVRVRSKHTGQRRIRRSAEDVDIKALELRLRDLVADLDLCDEKLEELNKELEIATSAPPSVRGGDAATKN